MAQCLSRAVFVQTMNLGEHAHTPCAHTNILVVHYFNFNGLVSVNVFVSCQYTLCWLCVCVCVSKESTLWRQTCSPLYKSGISWSTGGRVGGFKPYTGVCVCLCVCCFWKGKNTGNAVITITEKACTQKYILLFCICETSLTNLKGDIFCWNFLWYLGGLQTDIRLKPFF